MSKIKKQKYSGATLLALIGAQVFWGINVPVIKIGLRTVPLPVFLSVTLLSAALVLLPLARRYWQPMSNKDYALLTLASLIGITLGNVALLMGIQRVLALNASLIGLFKPLLLLMLSVEFLKEKFGWQNFWGILVALSGAAILIGQPWHSGASTESVGVLLIILSALCDVIATIMMKPVVTRSNSYQVTVIHLLAGIAPIAIYSLSYLHTLKLASITNVGFLAIIFNIILISIANVLFMFGLKYRKAQDTGIFQYIHPIATFIAAWIILGELPNQRLIVGATLVVAGIYFAEQPALKFWLGTNKTAPYKS